VFLLLSGLTLSSLDAFPIPFEPLSGRFSDDWERFRAFWAEPSMPSRLKLVVRADLSEFGDFSEFTPLTLAPSMGEGISTEKSRFGSGNCLMILALADAVMVAVEECGESPLDDGDMLSGAQDLVGCDSVADIQAPELPGLGGGRVSLLSLKSTTGSASVSAPTPTSNYSNNTVNALTRCLLSNSHYRAATSKIVIQYPGCYW
jgi:hypothetical protein